MRVFNYPDPAEWDELLKRPELEQASLREKVAGVLADIQQDGDAALKKYTALFDKTVPESFAVSAAELESAASALSPALRKAIEQAASNIRRFHEAQQQSVSVIETMPGVTCWRKSVGIDKVGLYIPGGTAPLFSTVLMLGIPAVLAGCKEIVLCTPPDAEGNIHPAVRFAASLIGITKLFKLGGVQAVGAMAFGTETVPKVYKIFGPGNQYVTAAKQLVQEYGTAIDMPAGPSEVCVLADDTANPAFVAADLLSQAEHGPDSQVLLLTTSESLAAAVERELTTQLNALPRKALAAEALTHSKTIVCKDLDMAVELANRYAAEHLIIACEASVAADIADRITNAGSVFLGHYSPESVGDYASGTNHTLPTNGYARMFSGVSLDSFVKKITYQQLSPEGLQQIGRTVTEMAQAEGLEAHARAVTLRLEQLSSHI